MPQLDIYIISSQIFWLLLKFNFFYFFMLKTYITEISKVFKFRDKVYTGFESEIQQLSNNPLNASVNNKAVSSSMLAKETNSIFNIFLNVFIKKPVLRNQ